MEPIVDKKWNRTREEMISEIIDEFKRRLPWFPFDAADLKDLSDEELTRYYREVCQGE